MTSKIIDGVYLLNVKLRKSPLRYFLFLGNWLFQGILIDDNWERALRLSVDLMIFMLTFKLISYFNICLAAALFISFLIAHSFNWFFNCHFWALLLQLHHIGNFSSNKRAFYLDTFKNNFRLTKCAICIAVIGSICRNEATDLSDVDMVIIRKEGFTNAIIASMIGFMLRADAFLSVIPLDLHITGDPNYLSTIRSDEKPLILYASDAFDKNAILAVHNGLYHID